MKKKKIKVDFTFRKLLSKNYWCLGLAMIMSNYLNKKEEEENY